MAIRCLEGSWRDGFRYTKAGVLLDDLGPPEAVPPDLRGGPRPGSAGLMAAIDALIARFGRGTIYPAVVGVERAWVQRAAHRSPGYTTRLDEVPQARA